MTRYGKIDIHKSINKEKKILDHIFFKDNKREKKE